jgi:hypothetical protein
LLSIVGAVATSTHTVLVTLSTPPLASSLIAAGDALNPATWTVVRDDTGLSFTVLESTMFDSVNFELYVLEPLAGWRITHTVSAPDLLDPFGDPIVPPESADFLGVESSALPYEQAGVVDIDLANPQTPPTGTPGTIRTTAAGDYDTEGGVALAEKLILRVITTAQGGFFYMPNFGLGLQPKLIVTIASLGALKAAVIRAVEGLSIVNSADAALSWDNTNGVLTVTVSAQLNSGQTVQVVNRTPLAQAQL